MKTWQDDWYGVHSTLLYSSCFCRANKTISVCWRQLLHGSAKGNGQIHTLWIFKNVIHTLTPKWTSPLAINVRLRTMQTTKHSVDSETLYAQLQHNTRRQHADRRNSTSTKKILTMATTRTGLKDYLVVFVSRDNKWKCTQHEKWLGTVCCQLAYFISNVMTHYSNDWWQTGQRDLESYMNMH